MMKDERGISAGDRLMVIGFLVVLLGVATAIGIDAVRRDSGRRGAGCPEEGFSASRSHPTPIGWQALVQANDRLIQRMRDVEKAMETAFPLRNRIFDLLLPVYRGLGTSVDKVIPGKAGWLFYEPDLLHLIGPGFLDNAGNSGMRSDPVLGVLDFYRQLRSRGIRLLVLPTPGKPAIVPEYLQQGGAGVEGPLKNPSWDGWVTALRLSGVDVLDVHELLWQRKRSGQVPYLRTDTHWTPDAVDAVAKVLAKTVESHLSGGPLLQMERRSVEISHHGDIAMMVDRAASYPLHDPEIVPIDQVLLLVGSIVSEERSAQILLIGDSFSNIYSSSRMGWGEGAGLADQLAFQLRQPVDRIVHNDAGAIAGRKALAAELARGRDRLVGKRVVIWQVACRELSFGDWAPVPLVLGNAQASPSFLMPVAGGVLRISGVVSEKSAVPTPGSVPYADHIMALHLTDVSSADGAISDAEALVYVFSMKAHRLTEAADLRAGERVCMDVRSWEDVERAFGSINRSELESDALMAVVPFWGEMVE